MKEHRAQSKENSENKTGRKSAATRLCAVRFSLFAVLCALGPVPFLVSGCAGTPPTGSDFEPPVYPPPPAEPRFVYERTLLYNDDVEEYTAGMRFKQYALGASRKLKGMVKPFDVSVHRGRVYVSDTVQRAVLLFDIPGQRYLEIGIEKPGALVKPLGVDTGPEGRLYVADVSAQRIMVYGPDGAFESSFGGSGQLRRPADVAVSRDGKRAYVVDTGGVDSESHVVHVFDTDDGRHIDTIGARGTDEGEFNLPLQGTVAADGTLYVVDSGNFRVQAFSPDGRFLSSFGSVGRLPGQFARPKGIATDSSGNIYVIDTAFGNFQIFNPQGELLMFVGERGQSGYPGKYMLPAGIAVDEDGRIYVADQFFRKVDIYRPVTLGAGEGYAAAPAH